MEAFDSHSDPPSDWQSRLTAERKFRFFAWLEDLLLRFSPAERLALYCLSIILALTSLALLIGVFHAYSVVIPARGGSLTEGEIGPVRFINPILTLSQADDDLTSLVYSGLMRAQADGSYVPDLAQSYTISPDGTVYTFKLRPGATFQDGTPVTSADVVFTVHLAQDPDIKSPEEANWDGVQVSAPDSHTVVFTLPHAYAPFMQDTTLGILPEHLWQDVSPEEFPFSPLNMHPVGSGPYKVQSFATDSTGSATRYDLAPFSAFTLGAPYLSHITFLFFPNQDTLAEAFNAGRINAIAGISPEDLAALKGADETLREVPLPRTFGVFFNQSHAPIFEDPAVRSAMNAAIDRDALVQSVLEGYGVPLNGPIPPGVTGEVPQTSLASLPIAKAASTTPIVAANIANAQAILRTGGWTFDQSTGVWTKGTKTKQTLSFTLSTADEPELVATANAVASVWRAAGISVQVQVYPLSEFNNTILRPRSYDAVLFGEVVGRTADLFAFWDSSQRNDPGLNLAMYANSKADALLSQARAKSDDEARDKLYQQFAAVVAKDQPAAFLYAPDFLYAAPSGLQGMDLGAITNPSERFLNVYEWYTETTRVWDIFSGSTTQ